MWLYLCGIEAVPTKASPERQGGVGGTSHRDSKGSISIVKRHGLAFMQNGVWSAAQYFDTFGDKWRAQPGAVEWAREHVSVGVYNCRDDTPHPPLGPESTRSPCCRRRQRQNRAEWA